MKKVIILIAVMILTALAYAQTAGETITEERVVDSFNRINVSSFVNVEIVTGKPQKVVVSGDSALLRNLITEVRGGELIVRYEYEKKKRKIKEEWGVLTVKICVEDITDLTTSGAVSTRFPERTELKKLKVLCTGASKLMFDDLEVSGAMNVTVSGASSLDIDGNTFGDVEVKASGASHVFFSGKADVLDLDLTGASNIKLSGHADEISVRASGASNVTSNKFTANKKSFSCSGAAGVYIND